MQTSDADCATQPPVVTAEDQHTAGPWRANHTFRQDDRPDGDWVTDITRSSTPTFLARVEQGGARPLLEARANARLIAAAPQMFAALQAIEQLTRGTLSTHVHRAAVDAIAKAKGRVP